MFRIVHFDLEYYGGPGIQVTPRPCECGGAEFEIVSYVKGADENFTVLYSVCDAEGNEVASACRPADETAVKVYVPDATLWEIDAPYLYTVTARLQRRNESYDEISARVGVRSFPVIRTKVHPQWYRDSAAWSEPSSGHAV